MTITANQITVAQKHEPEANCDLVTSVTVNPGATFDLSTPVGQNDNRMVVQEARTYLVGTSNTLESVAGAIDIQTGGVKAAQLDAGAVTEPAILDSNVTEPKIAPGAVTSSKLGAASVTTSAIAPANVTLATLAPDAITDLSGTTTPDQFIINNSVGQGIAIPLAAVGGFDFAGLVSKAQVDKLDGIEDNANNYAHPNHTGDVTSTGDGATVIQPGVVTLTMLDATAVTNLSTSQAASEITVNCSTGTNAVLPRATSTLSGLVNGSEHDALNPPTMSLVGNPEIATATAKGINSGSLPTQPANTGSRFIGWDAGGLLAEFDPTALTSTSRKADADNLGNQGTGTLAVDWDSGTYDNKQITLTADLNTVTFTATRNGKYQLHVVQDGTGFRKLNLTSVNSSPRLTNVALNYTAGAVTVLEFTYNASTGLFSW